MARPGGAAAGVPGKVKNYAIALLALALDRAGEQSRAFQVAKRLEKTVEDRRATRALAIYDWGFYSCNEYETTGYAMMALIRTDPRNPLIDQAARWLISQRQGGGWASTEDTASIIYALGAYMLREQSVSPPDYTATLRVNGQPAGLVRMTAARMFEAQTLSIPVALLHERSERGADRTARAGPADLRP